MTDNQTQPNHPSQRQHNNKETPHDHLEQTIRTLHQLADTLQQALDAQRQPQPAHDETPNTTPRTHPKTTQNLAQLLLAHNIPDHWGRRRTAQHLRMHGIPIRNQTLQEAINHLNHCQENAPTPQQPTHTANPPPGPVPTSPTAGQRP